MRVGEDLAGRQLGSMDAGRAAVLAVLCVQAVAQAGRRQQLGVRIPASICVCGTWPREGHPARPSPANGRDLPPIETEKLCCTRAVVTTPRSGFIHVAGDAPGHSWTWSDLPLTNGAQQAPQAHKRPWRRTASSSWVDWFCGGRGCDALSAIP